MILKKKTIVDEKGVEVVQQITLPQKPKFSAIARRSISTKNNSSFKAYFNIKPITIKKMTDAEKVNILYNSMIKKNQKQKEKLNRRSR